MAERKDEGVAPGRDDSVTETKMTVHRLQHAPNGGLPNFQSPTQLDSWFDAQLMQVYSEVVSEPLPKEFLDLLQRLKDKNAR